MIAGAWPWYLLFSVLIITTLTYGSENKLKEDNVHVQSHIAINKWVEIPTHISDFSVYICPFVLFSFINKLLIRSLEINDS